MGKSKEPPIDISDLFINEGALPRLRKPGTNEMITSWGEIRSKLKSKGIKIDSSYLTELLSGEGCARKDASTCYNSCIFINSVGIARLIDGINQRIQDTWDAAPVEKTRNVK